MSSGDLHVIVLAAGQGKRMRSARPKVLQTLAGQPLLEHVLSLAAQLGATHTTVVYGHGGEQVRDWAAGRALDWVQQQPPRGTGDAVRKVLCPPEGAPATPTTGIVLVLYGDVPLLQAESLQALLSQARQGDLALLTQTLEDPTGYGRILRNSQGQVQAIIEHKDANADQRAVSEVNTGILAAPQVDLQRWVAALGCDNVQQEYYLTDVVAMAVAEGRPVSTSAPGHVWEADGVNDPRQLARLERIWQTWQAGKLLDAGVRLADPARIDLRGTLHTGSDVDIDVGCVFEGEVTLADNVVVEPYCVLRNVRVGAGSVIRAYSHLDGADIGAQCVIGPYARLRPGTRLADRVHLGNFVEVKNTVIGQGSKANHLTYLGDADIGSAVNIGAGSITCNYDGVNKHRTVIGDRAFIGSDTQLVAPVAVGEGATIGAGTTLVLDAPAEQLTLSRALQRTVPHWQRPARNKP